MISRSKQAALCCRECGAVVFVALDRGAHRVTIDHDESCAFLRAVDAGRARLWCEANGYPIEAVTLESAGVA